MFPPCPPCPPRDLYTLRFWVPQTATMTVEARRLVYHASRPCVDVIGPRGDGGAPFEDEWAVVAESGEVQGRVRRWEHGFSHLRGLAGAYSTEKEATRWLERYAHERLAMAEHEASRMRSYLGYGVGD